MNFILLDRFSVLSSEHKTLLRNLGGNYLKIVTLLRNLRVTQNHNIIEELRGYLKIITLLRNLGVT